MKFMREERRASALLFEIMTPHDLRSLLNVRNVHWAVKAQLLNSFITKRNLTEVEAAYELAMDKDVVKEFMDLSSFSHKYPTLRKIPTKNSALKLIAKYWDNPEAMRAQIQLATIRNKSRLELTEIKSRFSKNKEKGETDE